MCPMGLEAFLLGGTACGWHLRAHLLDLGSQPPCPYLPDF